jgi:photosystem II stability/assembly factor-like uncharacterized protein
MKPILTAFLFCITVFQFSHSQWVSTGTFAGPVNAILTVQASDNNGGEIIYVGIGENEGVWKSTDDGETWTEMALDGKTVYSMAANGSYIVCGTDEEGVYFSSNGGTSWYQSGLYGCTVLSLEQRGSHLYAGTANYGVYCSDNNGANWVYIGLNGKSVSSLGSLGDALYAGTVTSGLYYTTNIGNTWTQTPLNNLHIVSIAINPVNNGIHAGTNTGIWRSTDGGMIWNQALADFTVLAAMISGGTVIAGTDGGVQVSYDNGTTWTPRNEGFNGLPGIRALRTANGQILAGGVMTRDGSDNIVFKRPLNELIGIIPISGQVPNGFELSQNYPNPFNPSTSIRFSLSKASIVKLTVFNTAGQEVVRLVNERLSVGSYEYQFDAGKLTSGVYFYRLTTDNFTDTKKMILVK